MAIKRFGDYEKTQAYGDYEALPKGVYIVKMKNGNTRKVVNK